MTKLKADLNKLMKTDGVADVIPWYEKGLMTLDDALRAMADVVEEDRIEKAEVVL